MQVFLQRRASVLCALPCRAPLSRKLFRLNRVFLEAKYWMKRCDRGDRKTKVNSWSDGGFQKGCYKIKYETYTKNE